jgi:peptide/nickel transport system substrate-binding protein
MGMLTISHSDEAGPGAFGNARPGSKRISSRAEFSSTAATPTSTSCTSSRAVELDHKKREAILHKMQQIVHERTIYAPIWQLAFINGIGPRVGEAGFGLIPRFPYTSPYEDITLKGT